MNDVVDHRPYRPNVGICLLNGHGSVWVGRCESSGPEIIYPGYGWQMPQGGIEENEDIIAAAKRELMEETGVSSAQFLLATDEWWTYEFPSGHLVSGHKLNPFRGQKQKWVAFKFEGQNNEISITAEHVGEPQEFFDWAWVPLKDMPDMVVPYKREVYNKVVRAFSGLI